MYVCSVIQSCLTPCDPMGCSMPSIPDGGKDRGQKEKRASEDEMAGRHH